jgi:serine protease
VAYTDRGPYARSPDLAPSRFVRGFDLVDDDPFPNDEFGHGTFVASIIAATANNG